MGRVADGDIANVLSMVFTNMMVLAFISAGATCFPFGLS